MEPLKHLVITALVFFLLKIFIYLPFSVLVYALLLTILIDIIDHSINIFFVNKPLSKKIKGMIIKFKIRGAYKLYYKKRKEDIYTFMLFHNSIFLLLSLILSFYLKSYAFFLGIPLHLICDIIEIKIEKNKYPAFTIKYYLDFFKKSNLR